MNTLKGCLHIFESLGLVDLMKILHLASTYYPQQDGVSMVVSNLSEALKSRGHEVNVCTGLAKNSAEYEIINGVCIHRFGIRGNSVEGIHGAKSKLTSYVLGGSWDVVVFHCIQTWSTDLFLHKIDEFVCPTILVTHGFSAIGLSSYSKYFDNLHHHIKKFSAWACISEFTEEFQYASRYNMAKPKLMNNGVDMKEWTRKSMNMRDRLGVSDKIWVLNVSNHSPVKGHADFYKIASNFSDNMHIYFSIAGKGYPASKWNLGKLGVKGGCYYSCNIKSRTRYKNVNLVSLKRVELVSAIREADLVVSTSNREANSIVILESMAAKTPWISFDVGSVKGNKGGVIASSVDDMTAIISKIILDRNMLISHGKKGFAQILMAHSWQNIAGEYEKLYLKCIHSQTDRSIRS
jgi:L-malate glycosyltransferase